MSARQYTCANDKNGIKIYEGDIVVVAGGNIGAVMYDNYERYHYIELLSAGKHTFIVELYNMYLIYRNIRDVNNLDLEVIGNIHEPQYYENKLYKEKAK